MSRVLIADDHSGHRAGYKQFLEADPSITEIGEAASGSETLDALRRKAWHLLLMGLHTPDRAALDVLKNVTTGYPKVRVLIMSGLPEEQHARAVLRAGARGYLPRGSSPEELRRAVRAVLAGRRYVSMAFAESLVTDLVNGRIHDQPLHSILSTREFQVFRKLAGGATVSLIAAELNLSVKTVSTYRSRIFEKTRFRSNADIVAYALEIGLSHPSLNDQ